MNSASDGGRYVILHDIPPPELEQAWRDGLARVQLPSHYDSPDFFKEPYWLGKDPFAILALSHGRVVGGLTGLHEKNEIVSGLPSRPQVFVDPSSDAHSVLGCLARGLLAEAGSAKLVTVYGWSWMPLDPYERYGFSRRELEGNVVLNLDGGLDTLFGQLGRKRRTNIRLAVRKGVTVRQAAYPEDKDEFYRLYLLWRQTSRKKIDGEPIARGVFEYRMQHPESFRIFLALVGDRIVAGINLRFCSGGLVEYANNCSLDDFLFLRPNDLLVWKAVEWACEQGFRRFSLGGAHAFLREFGGQVIPVWRYRLDRTMLRRHDLRDAALDCGRALLLKPSRTSRKRLTSFFKTKVAGSWRRLAS